MNSPLLVTVRAVDGDDWWVSRLKTACDLLEVPYTRTLGVRVTFAVSSMISLTENVPDTTNVPDDSIISAIAAEAGKVEAGGCPSDLLPDIMAAPEGFVPTPTVPDVAVGSDDQAALIDALQTQINLGEETITELIIERDAAREVVDILTEATDE